jgi:chromosome segregation ATPase
MNIDKIWARHGSNDLWIEADSDGWQAHEDRGVLLERIAELEADRDHQLRARKDLEGVIRKRNRRIAELEANQQSWQEHDQGRIFAAKAMQLRIEELEAERDALKEIIDDGCPRCDCDIVLWLGKVESD